MNQPLLHFLATKNYKNLCSEQPFYLSNLNIFIGSNGSGKSNFISCLKFLKNCLINIPEENRGVSSFEDAISKIGGTRILDSSVSSPATVNLYYCFSQISQTNNPQRDSVVFDLQLYTDRRETRATVSEEYLYGGEDLHDHANSDPFYYYKLHNRGLGKGVVSVYDQPGKYYPTHFETLDNIPTNSLGLSSITKILENSQSPPENTPIYKIRRELIDLVARWHFYNANNMDLNQIRTA
ncbi:MAG TPA: ATPase, partial [Oscillatoriales bacterium UBA8482]|nr:ATPase [Oscillatoriales bacterium UBA8482]